jgi:hypothetical protein
MLRALAARFSVGGGIAGGAAARAVAMPRMPRLPLDFQRPPARAVHLVALELPQEAEMRNRNGRRPKKANHGAR